MWLFDRRTHKEKLLVSGINSDADFAICPNAIYLSKLSNGNQQVVRFDKETGAESILMDMPQFQRLRFTIDQNCKSISYSVFTDMKSDIMSLSFSE